MLLTMLDLKALRNKLAACRLSEPHACQTPHLEDGQPFRLVAKPRARRSVLEKHHEVVVQDQTLYVKIPLGTHGTDHLAIDPATGEIVCALCKEGRKE